MTCGERKEREASIFRYTNEINTQATAKASALDVIKKTKSKC